MGEILQQMFGFLLISLLLVVSNSYPQINVHNVQNKQEHFISAENKHELVIKDKRNDKLDNSLEISQFINTNLLSRTTFLRKTQHTFRTIRKFTEKAIGHMLKLYMNNKNNRRHKTININSGEKLGKTNTSSENMIQNNLTPDNAVANSPETSYSDSNKRSINGLGISTIKLPLPAKSKADRWLPGLRTFRRRRSFFSDFGLESTFADDTTDVVFGAHTSACDHADRHYCLNGGTCVFVGALEIKTCR